jgi:hypothetical protein
VDAIREYQADVGQSLAECIDDYRLSLQASGRSKASRELCGLALPETLPAQTGLACAGMRGHLARTLTSRPPVNMPSVA